MPKELSKLYDPRSTEERLYNSWNNAGRFHTRIDRSKKPFTIVMPPPNVTGQLHMGHAMDETWQDVLIRYKRMQGYAALWVPGTDHASIATEAKVVEALREEGLTKEQLGREGFLKRAWDWKNTYGSRIEEQLKKLGSSCDWQRERFTLDEGCSNAVLTVFKQLYDQGLIYRGNRMINWCPHCKTSISDAEVEYEEQEGHFWHLLYTVKETGEKLELATTRPETMLGDTAVAVNPADERYQHLKGCHAVLPLLNKEIPIVFDEHADMEKGTGVVKITPAHDPNDFEVGNRHNLPRVRVFTYDGHMTGAVDKAEADAQRASGRAAEGEPDVLDCGPYAGMTTLQARAAILKDLESIGALKETENIRHDVGTCYRCHSVIEPMISKQWFVKMAPLAQPAIRAVEEGRIRFVPERFTRTYMNWMKNTRDWCISRQLWWGHQIPAWYCDDCGAVIVEKSTPEKCPRCASVHLTRDPDTLDTWFSSALWPFSTLGWPEKTEDYDYFYPTDVLVTGYDIIGFWVSRMIFSALAYTGDIPFHTVLIHGLVRDSQGRKMSKSLGNGVNPLEVIEKYGADALRMMLLIGSTAGNDIRYSEERLIACRNFANKLWNASRFVQMNLPEDFVPGMPGDEDLDVSDKWVLSELSKVAELATANLEKYELGLAAEKVETFIWETYCDWYIEICKARLASQDAKQADTARKVLVWVLDKALKLLHPFMPFITEEIYLSLPGSGESIMETAWPGPGEGRETLPVWEQDCADFEKLMDYIKAVRAMRSEMNVHPAKRTHMVIETAHTQAFRSGGAYLARFAFATDIELTEKYTGTTQGMVIVNTPDARGFIPLKELIDRDKELARLHKELDKTEKELAMFTDQLANARFIEKAPAALVEQTRAKRTAAEEKKHNLETSLAALADAGA